MDHLQLMLPITKVDAAQRLVYGVAAAEVPDRAQEIMDYASTKPNFEQWSEEVNKASGGKSLGNVRAMHGNIAAGVLKQLACNDDERRIEVCAHIVDDNEWAKCEAGVYTGFSMGGRYVKRWKDEGLTRYTAEPIELSLVDMPCIPTATFEMIKADGSTELRKFTSIEDENPDTEATHESAETGAEAASSQPTDETDAVHTGVEKQAALSVKKYELAQVWDCGCPDHRHIKKSDAQRCVDDAYESALAKAVSAPMDAAIERLSAAIEAKTMMSREAVLKFAAEWQEGVTVPDKFGAGLAKVIADPDDRFGQAVAKIEPSDEGCDTLFNDKVMAIIKAHAIEASTLALAVPALPATLFKIDRTDVKKSLDQVSCLASLLDHLASLQAWVDAEAQSEGDSSSVPSDLMLAIKTLSTILTTMVGEETSELVATLSGGGSDEAALALFDAPSMQKSLLDTFLTKAQGIALGEVGQAFLEKVGRRHSKQDANTIQAMHDHAADLGATCRTEKIAKADGLADEAAIEYAAMKKNHDVLIATVNELTKKVEAMSVQPAQPQAKLYAFSKIDDGRVASPQKDDPSLEEQLAKMTPQERSLLLTKIALRNPINVRT